MTTIKQIAKLANVSVATVSRVLNDGPKVGAKTRQHVKDIIKKHNYSMNANARALATNDNSTLGLIIPNVAESFFSALAHGVDGVAKANDMQLLLSTCEDDADSEKKAIELLRERRCQSIVFHSKHLSDKELASYCDNIPGLIIINRFLPQYTDRCIWLDNKEGGRIAARHLLTLDHKEIACINSNKCIDDPQLRLSGLQEELAKQNIPLSEESILSFTPTQEGGEEAAQKLIASGQSFTAIFAYNDAMAIGAISTLEDNNIKVPRDVSVIGFDDVILAKYSRPKLTTLSYPIKKMSELAANLAIALANKKNVPVQELKYIPRLIKRESTIHK